MVEKHSDIYYELLRAGLWDKTPIMSSSPNWAYILETALADQTYGFVFYAALRLEKGQTPPMKMVSKFNYHLMRVAELNKSRDRQVVALFTKLRAEGIEPVLMKGQSLAALYPIKGLRYSCDIDIYVNKPDFGKACKVINSMADAKALKQSVWTDKHYHIKINSTLIEMHFVSGNRSVKKLIPIYNMYSEKGMTEDLSSVVINGCTINMPNDEFNAMYVLYHSWDHFLHGNSRLRQVCDWTMLIHSRHGRLNLNYLKEMLEKNKLMKAWEIYGCIAVYKLGLPYEEVPFYNELAKKKAEQALKYIHKDAKRMIDKRKPRGFLGKELWSFKMTFVILWERSRFAPSEVVLNFFKGFVSSTLGILKKYRNFKENQNKTD